MTMSDGKRTNMIHFAVSDQESELIEKKMCSAGMRNLSAFLRGLVLNGYVLQTEIPGIKEVLFLQRNMSNNLNQIAKRVNSGGKVYETELNEILNGQKDIWKLLDRILIVLEKRKGEKTK